MATPGKPDMFDKAMVLYDEGKFMEGYTLITENAHEHPDFMQRSFYFRHCLIARAGDLTLAEEILEDALDQGYFFSENASGRRMTWQSCRVDSSSKSWFPATW